MRALIGVDHGSERLGLAGKAGEGCRRLPLFIIWSVIGITMLLVWLAARPHHLIPCAQNCGETFVAMHQVRNYRLYGLKYGLLEDMATSPDPAAHPFLYTHNVNIGSVLFTLLEAIGFAPFWVKQLVTLLGFGLGLFYGYRATAFHTRAWWVGGVLLVLFATDHEHVLNFALNALRTWAWLALFGLLFHVGRLALQPLARPWVDRIAILAFAVLSFGLGYDFWVICFLVSMFLLLFCLPRPIFSGRSLRTIGWTCVAFAIPAMIRQVQVAAVVGPSFYAWDLYYSIAIKVTLLGQVLPLPTLDEVNRFYESHGILRPPAKPRSLFTTLRNLRDMLFTVTIPTMGLLAVIVAVVVGASAVAVVVRDTCSRGRSVFSLAERGALASLDRSRIVGASRLMAALALGIPAGMAVFAPLSFSIYLKSQNPLIAAPLLLAKALALTLGMWLFWRWRSARSAWRWLALSAVCVLVVDHALVQADDLRARVPMDVSWIDAVLARADSTFAVSWIPSSAAVFTRNWAVGIHPGREREILQRMRAGKQPFTLSDYLLFVEGDAKRKRDMYLKPDYWLYFPTDPTLLFDHPSGTCRQDYLTAWLSRLLPREPVPIWPPMAWPPVGPPGTILSVVGKVKIAGGPSPRVELVSRGQVVTGLIHPCQYPDYYGHYQVPTDAPDGLTIYEVRVAYGDGRAFVIGEVWFRVSRAASASPWPPVSYRAPQPSIDQIVTENPNLRIAERGAGYVIFDLRPLFGRGR